ncbi:polysaccharide deacetylase family protein [Nautilia sp.]
MKKAIIFLWVFLFADIKDYKAVFYCINPSTAVIRTFVKNGEKMQLEVNTRTLQTKITPFQNVEHIKCHPDSKYLKLLALSAKPPYPLQNDGITHGKKGMYITTDLCPSSKEGFEKKAYEEIIKSFKNPAPVTVFITSGWIKKHKKEFFQLIKWKKEKKLDLNWGNHTATHPYKRSLPLNKNFVLTKGYNLKKDTLNLEKTLIKYNQTPSVFFRFPGLVSDKKAIMTVKFLGLITIGADAWLAKGETPGKGSIILIHGNKNEPKGIKIFLQMIKEGKIKNIKNLNFI